LALRQAALKRHERLFGIFPSVHDHNSIIIGRYIESTKKTNVQRSGNMKKTWLIVLAAVLLLGAVAVFAFGFRAARTANMRVYYGYGADATDLTDDQEAGLDDSCDEILELRKETILTMMEDGLMSEEQGQLALERLDAMDALHDADDESYYYGGCYGGCGRGMARYYDGLYQG